MRKQKIGQINGRKKIDRTNRLFKRKKGQITEEKPGSETKNRTDE